MRKKSVCRFLTGNSFRIHGDGKTWGALSGTFQGGQTHKTTTQTTIYSYTDTKTDMAARSFFLPKYDTNGTIQHRCGEHDGHAHAV